MRLFKKKDEKGKCMKVAFVILNYNTASQTEKCIDSIVERSSEIEFKIGLLDNGSKDSSCAELVESKYKNLIRGGRLLFAESKKNLGFAGGNNFMFDKILASGFNADFYVFLNNDVYLVSNDFCQKIQDEYNRSKFSVLGPIIILGNNFIDCCPFSLPSMQELKKQIFYWKAAKLFSGLRLIKIFLFFNKIYAFVGKIAGKKSSFICKVERKENVLLHGACLIFSNEYFRFYKEPFDSRTFLYKEEELLYIRLLKKKLISVFEPNLIVFHEGGSSTVKNRDLNGLFRFRAEHYLKSLSILKSELESM